MAAKGKGASSIIVDRRVTIPSAPCILALRARSNHAAVRPQDRKDMAYFKIDCFEADLRMPDNLSLGDDEILWLYDRKTNAIVSIDLTSRAITQHFQDNSLCEFRAFGNRGIIGTWEGRIGLLNLNGKHHAEPSYVTVHDGCAIGSIDYDAEGDAIFVLAANTIYRILANEEVDCVWNCLSQAFRIRWVPRSKTLWCACRGLEIIDIRRHTSIKVEPREYFQYGDIAVSSSEEVVCCGGDADIFDSRGERLKMISGDFNRGIFRPDGRLILRDVKFAEAGNVASRDDFDVVSLWDSFAINPAGTRLVTLGRGQLSVFAVG